MSDVDYQKYLKYKIKYLELKNLIGSGTDLFTIIEDEILKDKSKLEKIKKYIKKNEKTQPQDTYRSDTDKYTPLHFAIRKKLSKEIIESLITKKNKDIKNKQGRTPLHEAKKMNKSKEIIDLLK